jgi:hypothetical protein
MGGLLVLLLLSAGVMLCWLGIFLSLPASATDLSSAYAEAEAAEVDGGVNAPSPDGSYPITPAEEVQQTERHPVNAYLLTMLVLAVASFGASGGWLLMTNAWRLGAMYCWVANDRSWLAAAHEGPSLLGVFRL